MAVSLKEHSLHTTRISVALGGSSSWLAKEVACFPCPFALSSHILSSSGGRFHEGSCQSGFPICHSKDLSGSLQRSSSAHSWHYNCRSNRCMWLSCLDGYLCQNAGSCYLYSLLMCQAGTLDLWVLKCPPPVPWMGKIVKRKPSGRDTLTSR